MAPSEKPLHIDYAEIITPEWTPDECEMFMAGLVPVKRITREEALKMFPRPEDK